MKNSKNPYEGFDFEKEATYVFQLTERVSGKGVAVDHRGSIVEDATPPFPKYVILRNPCLVYDEASGRERFARALQGYSSIWQDEQDTPAKLETSIVDGLKMSVRFDDGILIVKTPQDATFLKFLLVHDDYSGKEIRKTNRPPQFELMNKKFTADEELKKLDEIDKAVEKVKSIKNIDNHLEHIDFMNVKMYDAYGQRLPDSQVLLNYRKAAEANPRVFNKTFDSPEIKIKHKIKQAIAGGKIDLERVKGQAHFGDTGAIITVLDISKDPVDFLTEFAVSKEGSGFLKKIQ